MNTTVLIAQSYGSADKVLEFYTQELPPLNSDMARIKVKTAGINPIDARRMTGEFKHGNMPQTFGTEFAGEILEINSDNNQFKVGDAVLGSGGSFTHATVIDVPIGNLISKPESMSWEVAGSLAGVSQTASTILDEIGDIKSLLIHGASGGVGSITIQLAKERGIDVVATASSKNQDYLKKLGAVPVIYGEGLVDRLKEVHPEAFDASIDMSGTEEATQASLSTVKADGFIGTIAGKLVSSPRVKPVWVKRNVNNLKHVVEGVAKGKFYWEVDKVFPFEKAAEAYTYILEGHTRGKNVLQF
ncbi:NADP-dependent oxidoreductase [Chryseobacterium oryctis]|uniref:NADP-dependent oxidoreductase n=1 Tax=Chryseobacterium oryctis TaxID=2952618 RepID=A0ABT3HRT6_9FLAO|nr:NADP-dependent oxidoreductase [Chryseobacterium oryctis]MCW3162501.1 NADP-dependent oxidoreductase [Chryseobacterium oryctis]